MKRLLVLLSILAVLLAGCGGQSTASSSQPTPTQSSPTPIPTPAPPKHHALGESVQVGDWTMKIEHARTVEGQYTYGVPSLPDGTFLVIHITLTNTSSSIQKFSSTNYFTLRDLQGKDISWTAINGPDVQDDPMGEVEPGKPLQGDIKYEVPKAEKNFTLMYEVPPAGYGTPTPTPSASTFGPAIYFWDITLP